MPTRGLTSWVCLAVLAAVAAVGRPTGAGPVPPTCSCFDGASTLRSSASSICVVIEDGTGCTVSALGPQQLDQPWLVQRFGGPDRVAERLRQAGVPATPRRVLVMATTKAPDAWTDDDLPVLFSGLLALAVPDRHLQTVAQIHERLQSHATGLRKVFANPKPAGHSESSTIDDLEVVVSFGCLEVHQGEFQAQVKHPMAFARIRCDLF